MRLAGKTVLLTGGGSGIGFALARQLAAKGARLALCGRRPEPLDEAVRVLRAAGGEAIRVRGDVAQEDDRARMVDDTVRQLGGLDVLINNAGNVRAGRLEATHAADIQAMIEVDLLAPILMTQLALPYLRRSGEALIVNIASGIALIGMPFYAAYAAAKAGLARFGEALPLELHGDGVRPHRVPWRDPHPDHGLEQGGSRPRLHTRGAPSQRGRRQTGHRVGGDRG